MGEAICSESIHQSISGHSLITMSDAEPYPRMEETTMAFNIGAVLHHLRKQQGLTLDGLAKRSGVSRSMLSQIETGKSIPSILVLCKLARSFGVPLNQFVEAGKSDEPFYLSADDAPIRLSAGGKCAWRSLTDQSHSQNLEFFELTLSGGGIERVAPYPQGTKANLVVCQGVLSVSLDGDRQSLSEGDALEFAADVPHSYINSERHTVTAYLVLRLC